MAGKDAEQERGAQEAQESGTQETSATESLSAFAAVLILMAAAFSSNVSQLNLSPVYGSIPASRFHYQAMICTGLLAILVRPELRRFNLRTWLPVLACHVPVLQHYLFRFSSQLGPTYGPTVTELITYYPLLLLSISSACSTFESFDFSNMSPTIAEYAPLVLAFVVFRAGKSSADYMLPSLVGTSAFFTRSGMRLMSVVAYTAIAPSKLVLLGMPALLWFSRMNPHWASPGTTSLLNTTLHAYQYTLLERRESLTGYLSVLESQENHFRVLRCDHSLLGGDWLVTEESIKRGQSVPESVYSVFTMLEAVRLVERSEQIADADASALFIGLGTGTSPKAFIEHGIDTTVVEIDPVVHDFATRYFGLPDRHRTYIRDAQEFISSSDAKVYDYIIHDVFTGGAEPTALFTLGFLQKLDLHLKDSGVIAINYAADLSVPTAKIVLRTILQVFPSCRMFRDMSQEDSDSDYVNMVAFCVKQRGRKITFRPAVEADWLQSGSRKQWIPPKDSYEVPIKSLLTKSEREADQLVLKEGKEAMLQRFHHTSTERHWRIMRTVLPDAVWELW